MIAAQPVKWMAYRMQGFGGLVVTESIRVDERGRMWTPAGDGYWNRRIESDGPLFDTREECDAACREANKGRAN